MCRLINNMNSQTLYKDEDEYATHVINALETALNKQNEYVEQTDVSVDRFIDSFPAQDRKHGNEDFLSLDVTITSATDNKNRVRLDNRFQDAVDLMKGMGWYLSDMSTQFYNGEQRIDLSFFTDRFDD